MPPRVQDVNQAGTGVKAWWQSLPPITRWMATLMLVITVGANLGFIPPMWLVLMWQPIIKKFEIWRLVTNFLLLGKLSFNFLIRMIWVVQYGTQLESQVYQFEPADFFFMLLVCGGLLLAASPFLGLMLNGVPLIMALIYVWARNFPDQQVSLYGLIKIQSFYLPFAFACITLLMGQSVVPDLAGIAVGHVYYFLKDVYPVQAGKQVLVCPNFIKQWLADMGVRGAAPPPREAQGVPQGFQAFRGSGRRLGS